MKRPVILVVDDKPNMLRLMTKVFRADGDVKTAAGGAEALRLLACEPIDVVLCDLKMPDMDGLDVLRASKRLRPGAEFVLMTAYASVGTAVEALKLGAYDYISKPFEPEEARAVVLRALGRTSGADTAAERPPEVLPGVIARSRSMDDVGAFVRKVARSTATVLILGETGTGKERVARAVHELSDRAGKRFVALNCAALPPDLLESELFGHARGAFTGAVGEKRGLFEEADGGTLFLDEVGDMRPSLQAKLTRVLEERTFRRVGETRERHVDVRIVAATHRDLEGMVGSGTFRGDLWYRLNVAKIDLPPLRWRQEDIPLLVHHFLRELRESHPAGPHGFTDDALQSLVKFEWPGNVRELKAAVERGFLVASGTEIGLGDLPEALRRPTPEGFEGLVGLSWNEAMDRGRQWIGRQYLEAVLARYGGNVVDAAVHAGVERESFYRLMRKYDVDVSAFREGV